MFFHFISLISQKLHATKFFAFSEETKHQINAIKKNQKFGYVVFFLKTADSLGSLSFKSLILVKKQEPQQASKCPGVGVYPKNRNNFYVYKGTIVTSQRKNIKVLVYSTDF